MNPLFVDSDVLIAVNDKDDPSYKQVQLILASFSEREPQFYTSTNVILESVTIISQRLGKREGIDFLNELRSGKYTIVHPDEEFISSAEDIFRAIKSKNISYSDCISFAVMRRYGIRWVFSFDSHFKKMGFKRIGLDK